MGHSKSGPNRKTTILLIDDDATFSKVFSRELLRMDYEVGIVSAGHKGLEALGKRDYDIVLLDLCMPEVDGLTVLSSIKENHPETTVIMPTGYATVDTAIKSMKMGAFDYLTKPFRLDEVKLSIEKAMETKRLTESNVKLKQGLSERGFSEMIGESKAMRKVFDLINKVAPLDSTVLLLGESGTGKELASRAIHRRSLRADEPFVLVDCGALQENLLESELFGHEKGAFTGAIKRKHGLFEAASGGTVFLDEIGDVSPSTQTKLLRVIETGEFRRLGSTETVQVDVRIVAATNRDLEKMVADGVFRQDLFYRLNVFHIRIPPLRERNGDILLLADYFLKKKSRFFNEPRNLSETAREVISNSDWPGNVRELENAIERAAILSDSPEIGLDHLPGSLTRSFSFSKRVGDYKTLVEIEDEYIRFILDKCGGNRGKAAAILGLDPKTIYRRLKEDRA